MRRVRSATTNLQTNNEKSTGGASLNAEAGVLCPNCGRVYIMCVATVSDGLGDVMFEYLVGWGSLLRVCGCGECRCFGFRVAQIVGALVCRQ